MWWKTSVVYHIYPRSFQDSNSDGIGDLEGIRSRLDYLQWLGVQAIWLSPIYPSPMHDFGYDVSDYRGINSLFGTLEDFDRLLSDVHKRGMKLLLDLVPNHTSDEHEWFKESRSSRDNPKRDYYIWRDAKADGSPPNNWKSFFGGSAWEWDENTQQYYLHQFVKQQPELNYRNPKVEEEMLDIIKFWMDKGIDGFRVDVIWALIKDELFRDEPPNPEWDGVDPFCSLNHIYTQDLPEVHSIIRNMRSVLDKYESRVLIGEIYLPIPKLMAYYGKQHDECQLPFNFHLLLLIKHREWGAKNVRSLVEEYETSLPENCWPNWVLGNHDNHRIATALGQHQTRIAMMLLLTLRGTPTIYYGEELGMEDVKIPTDMVQDPPAVNQPEIADIVGRDPERTPMQWTAAVPNASFCAPSVKPWLPLAPDSATCNVEAQKKDPTSMLQLVRSLLQLRQQETPLTLGDYATVSLAEDVTTHVYAFTRSCEGQSLLIVLNFASTALTVAVKDALPTFREHAEVLLSTSTLPRSETEVLLSSISLQPDEGIVCRLVHTSQH